MEVIHRWPNRPVNLGGTLYWDFPGLFAELIAAMQMCDDRGLLKPAAIGVDTWGVDFGLLADGQLLGNPVHYRDARTQGIHAYADPIMPRGEIYALTGYEPWSISSLFQLLALKRTGASVLAAAQMFLNMPDLFNFFLTGRAASERSIANTSNLMGIDGQWSRPILDRFGLPEKLFSPLIEPATVLGPLAGPVAVATGLADVPVVAVCGHDTSCAVAAVPAEGHDWAFLSCGTWSILGCLVDKPVATPRSLELGWTNEYTLGGWYLARNILGLWLVQQLRAKWNTPADSWDYARMLAEARGTTPLGEGALIDVSDESLLAPRDMEQALRANLARAGGKTAESATRGQLVRAVLESLALEYAWGLEVLSELTGHPRRKLFMVGGGIANELLCQFTADACGLPIAAGANECTALGNALCQARALGVLTSNEQIRQVMRNSAQIRDYQPHDQALWTIKRGSYRQLRGQWRKH
jgi:rhamnulokinase